MILNPIIQVECDECGEVIELTLTIISKGWDDRDAKKQLKEKGWRLGLNGETFCSRGCEVLYEEA